ncbi:hypothetical protein EX895_001092 [Sporisorium graminicola]|uniref:Dynamin-type G domain-containing protein n=1 Tax=Sporisorium graminicola TaxID=280036 RepID=A0A4U7KY56_9BASI|nr:hypothetical protein EX895_001092 [Sporisorium graminicola]TKY89795.1 hypothetical protein EX895_001092 [Sporisorium graminicola]
MDRPGLAQGVIPIDKMRSADYGAVVRRLIFLCQQVEALSVPLQDSTTSKGHLSLPRLVLVGGQSAGKSSLVECLAGISLPRSQGTCTRGPLDIVITSTVDGANDRGSVGDNWYAILSLVLPESKAGRPSPPGACGGIVQFGAAIDDPARVADRIRQASLAVLDLINLPPLKPGSCVIDDSPYLLMSSDELVFAEDGAESSLATFFPAGTRLLLSIRSPGAEPLHFTDLPGLIASGRPSEINAPRNMIKREIRDNNVIIVFVASLANDLRNQGGFALAREADPTGARTIGVLTMPDRMVPSSARQWAKMINDSSSHNIQDDQGFPSSYYHLKHGWHVVRCAASNEDRNDVRHVEDCFFHSEVNDATFEWHQTASMLDSVGEDGNESFVETRCGLDNLHYHLSQLLLQQIRSTLPKTIASATKLLQDVTLHHRAAVTEANNGNGQLGDKAGAAINKIAQSFSTRSFSTRRELFICVDDIVSHFHILSHNINSELAPRLNHELLAIAPIYLPFTAVEARDRALTAAYRPKPWTFCSKLLGAAAAVSLDLERQDDETGAMSSTGNVASSAACLRSMLPKKKPITVDELIEELKRGPSFSHAVASTHIFTEVHAQFQTKFRTAILNYAGVAKEHLALLIRNAIPAHLIDLYPQLVADLLDIANDFVQGRLSEEMHTVAEGAAQHSLYEYGTTGGRTGIYHFDAVNTDGESDTEYIKWVKDEQQAYLMLRMSLIAKERAEVGDRNFMVQVNKVINFQCKAGLVSKEDFERLGYVTGGSKTRALAAELEDGPAVETNAQPALRSQAKGSKKIAAAAARTTPSPAPTIFGKDERIPSSSTHTRRCTTGALDDTVDASELSRAAPGVYSTPKLTIHRHLVLIAETLIRKQRWLYTAIELMAHLRGDFNFFSLLVADKAHGIPVWLMKSLYSYLRHTVSRDFGSNLSDDEVYQRYFIKADRPRREEMERVVQLKERVEQLKERMERIAGVVGELQQLADQLDRVVAQAGKHLRSGHSRWRTEFDGRIHAGSAQTAPGTPQHHRTTATTTGSDTSPSTPRKSHHRTASNTAATCADSTTTKRQGSTTPTRSQQLQQQFKTSVTPQKRTMMRDEPATPTKMRTTCAAAPTRSIAKMMLSNSVPLEPLAYEADATDCSSDATQAHQEEHGEAHHRAGGKDDWSDPRLESQVIVSDSEGSF